MKKCLVVMSGGQDSTTCLFKALNEYGHVEAVCFDYGQKHKIELEKAKAICEKVGVKLKEIDIRFLTSMGRSSLTENGDDVFVCNRNALFLTIAHGVAQGIGAGVVIAGMCQGDFNWFPDCREGFIQSLEQTLNLGYNTNIKFVTPLMYKTKAGTFRLAKEMGILETILNDTHTCYEGSSLKHLWGRGCGECSACIVRKMGYLEWSVSEGEFSDV